MYIHFSVFSNSSTRPSEIPEEVVHQFPLEKVREGGVLLAPGKQCRVCLRAFEIGQFVRKLPRCKHKVSNYRGGRGEGGRGEGHCWPWGVSAGSVSGPSRSDSLSGSYRGVNTRLGRICIVLIEKKTVQVRLREKKRN